MRASHVNAERSGNGEERAQGERERSSEQTYQKTLGRERSVEREVENRRARRVTKIG